ncbi:hypothetical protein S58_38080 [Bradyrhizobium oligotrophicum S58]|uniref:SPOR domain-containing protein n=1 Tax=Bradyrhizobium oligotrophicum S58 TaxID=1245469 RepID=M4Z863_9BRAD|nr:hypothetical protein [Bradyrhizobium oligotrophicum]BAM89798.1 hypothetical protein S58_38080 [Bradyrhizobium oligotrophicum S58]
MAKDSHKSAGAHGAEKTGATLSGLFADENELDRRAMWRLGWWGVGAVGAVGLAVFASQAAQGWRKDRISAADLSRQAQLLQSLARDTQGEARQLGAAIETLNTDRDRLYARVTVLEQGLESVTGALAKQSSQAAANPAAGSRAVPPQIASVDSQAAVAAAPNPATPSAAAPSPATPSPLPAFANLSPFMPAPGAAPGTSVGQPGATATPAASADKARPEASKSSPTTISSGGSPLPSAAASSPTPSASPAPAASAGGSKPAMEAAAKPAEADRLAKADPADTAGARPAESTEAAATAVQRTEFAVDLGGANSIGGLRALWRGLVKTNTDLASLRPIIMLKEGRNGPGMQLRLGAGPLTDAAAAARICAVMAETQHTCETTVYDGQRLAVGEEPEATETAKPAAPAAAAQKPFPTQRRRSFQPQAQQQRHGKREEPPAAAPPAPPPAAEAPKPEPQPSALSSFFRRS